MKVCMKCKVEMRCKKTGVQLHYGHGHCYAGDFYECSNCDNQIVVANETPWQAGDRLQRLKDSLGKWFIEMKGGE